ncbi:MAG: T9SS type A sorting domain-containing protein [Prolixibacteraceae bacterium]|nr:T9SS type A sorting domain-containing protein [Prolixibacteraceae bacterium]MBN2648931.1 T9SS type A sorting domain-containing protein [Prolixibacteraceae bacterium]
MKRTTILSICLFIYSLSGFGQIIINHSNTDITALSEQEINEAKSLLHIAYGHTSHGSQLTDGMTKLVDFANGGGKGLSLPTDIFEWNDGGTDGALHLHDNAMDGDVGYYPQWVNNTTSYLGPVDSETGKGTYNPDMNVILWSWCGQAAGYSEQDMIDKYLTPMNTLEETYYNVKFVYMTCHLNGTGENGNLNLRNEQIRNYCLVNNKILYDFADIESYDPDGLVNYMLLNANDNCDYDSDGNGSLDKNWAADWQNTHTENDDWYTCSCIHSQALNGNQKAYAAWNLFSEIAKEIKRESIPNNEIVVDNQQSIVVYPTPNNGRFTIKLENIDSETRVLIYSSVGQIVYDATMTDNSLSFELTDLQRGIYFIKAINNQKQFDQKIVVQ